MEAKKFKRKKRFIKNSSQPVLILRIYLILIFVMLASGAVFYFMGNQSLTKELFQAHSIIKNTMQLLLPGLILVNAIGLLGASLLVVVFTHSIAGPIYRLKMLSERIASGDLSVEVKFRSKDTIQELSDIMNTILVDGKEVPLLQAKGKTTIKNKESGVVYKDEQEWKTLGIDPAQIQRDVKITLPRLDLLAKTK